MLLAIPAAAINAVYIFAAVLPAFFLLRYIYRKDRAEKEPAGLLCSLLLAGVLAAFVAAALELVGQRILAPLSNTRLYPVLNAFLVVAAAEEGAKFYFLKRRTWFDPNFNYRFDAIVYAVFVSLGFAAYENIQYVIRYGLSVALPRALLAVPGHMGFSVYMGVFYGRARLCENRGDVIGRKRSLLLAYLSPVLLHGFYDACLMVGTTLSMGLFVLFVLVQYIAVFRLVRRESAGDRPLW